MFQIGKCVTALGIVISLSLSSRAAIAAEYEDWGFHAQATYVNQWHESFTSPYSAANSMNSSASNNETVDITAMLGKRLWRGAEFWINPEIDQGFGLSNTLGLAGFSSGEAYKIGENKPYLRLPRVFVRQVFALDGGSQIVSGAPNQLAGTVPVNNLTLTAGKFSVVDIFDNNAYAHDPRSDFLNWSVIDSGTFDYAADPWGFTNGIALEWNQGDWTLRGGAFQMSEVPNSKLSGLHFHSHSFVTEIEERHEWSGHPGKLKLLAFLNQADMGSYRDALQLAQATGTVPDVALVRKDSSNPGVTFNGEQELANGVGIFARAGINSGKKETYEFTDMNRTVSAGMSVQGTRWGREKDQLGMAMAVNALSQDARAYFAAGGMGILIGDGKLNYAREQVLEVYYSAQLNACLKLSFDYQHVNNPAYNQDRGPISLYAIRLHAEL